MSFFPSPLRSTTSMGQLACGKSQSLCKAHGCVRGVVLRAVHTSRSPKRMSSRPSPLMSPKPRPWPLVFTPAFVNHPRLEDGFARRRSSRTSTAPWDSPCSTNSRRTPARRHRPCRGRSVHSFWPILVSASTCFDHRSPFASPSAFGFSYQTISPSMKEPLTMSGQPSPFTS